MIYDGVPHHLFTIPKRIYFFYGLGWAFIICFTTYDRCNLFLLYTIVIRSGIFGPSVQRTIISSRAATMSQAINVSWIWRISIRNTKRTAGRHEQRAYSLAVFPGMNLDGQ